MIKTKEDLHHFLSVEDAFYQGNVGRWKHLLSAILYSGVTTRIHRYVRLLRYAEYYHNNSYKFTGRKLAVVNDILCIFYRRRLAKLGTQLGFEVGLNSCDCGLKIFHAGFLVINYQARIGKNAIFHGCNCVGNSSSGVPVIGDNVEFGVGSSVIGGVTLADNIKIGAGAVVTKSCLKSDSVLMGIPAQMK